MAGTVDQMRGSVAKVHLLTDGGMVCLRARWCMRPTIVYLERAYDSSKYGEISASPYLEVTTSGTVVSMHFQFGALRTAERRLANVACQRSKSGQSTLSRALPGVEGLDTRQCSTITPLDLEQRWGLTEGDLNHGQLILDQIFFLRPLPGWSNHRTPIDGAVPVRQSGVHGGGGISGASGRNAARLLLRE